MIPGTAHRYQQQHHIVAMAPPSKGSASYFGASAISPPGSPTKTTKKTPVTTPTTTSSSSQPQQPAASSAAAPSIPPTPPSYVTLWCESFSLFRTLATQYSVLFSIMRTGGANSSRSTAKVSKQPSYVVCIPPDSAIPTARPNAHVSYALLKAHILQPHPAAGENAYTSMLFAGAGAEVVMYRPWECPCGGGSCEECVFRDVKAKGVGTLEITSAPLAMPSSSSTPSVTRVSRAETHEGILYLFIDGLLRLTAADIALQQQRSALRESFALARGLTNTSLSQPVIADADLSPPPVSSVNNNNNTNNKRVSTSNVSTMPTSQERLEMLHARCSGDVAKERELVALEEELVLRSRGFIPPGFEAQTASALLCLGDDFLNFLLEDLQRQQLHSNNNNNNAEETMLSDDEIEGIEIAVNTFVVSHTYTLTMPSWRRRFQEQDDAFHAAASGLRLYVTYASLDIPPALRGHDTTEAVAMLRSLDSTLHTSTYEILRCMDGIIGAVHGQHVSGDEGADDMMTADECLPLLIHLIVTAAPLHLPSTIEFVTSFAYASMQFSSLGYVLTTFEAAKLYVLEEARQRGVLSTVSAGVTGPTDVIQRFHADEYVSKERLMRALEDTSMGLQQRSSSFSSSSF
eukprot:PhM_4_TR4821/c0_g1_i1/m.5756